MKILLDSGVLYRLGIKAPVPAGLLRCVAAADTDIFVCAVSVQELVYKWSRGRLTPAPLSAWLHPALESCRTAPVTFAAAELAGSWPWPHGDPADRLLAAVAQTQDLTLIHTDHLLKDLPGFPQKFFRL